MNKNLMPVTFEKANKKLAAPNCGDLPVFHGEGHFISCWELTEEQIRLIAETKRIWLGVKAEGHPPVWLTLAYPFVNVDEWPEVVFEGETK